VGAILLSKKTEGHLDTPEPTTSKSSWQEKGGTNRMSISTIKTTKGHQIERKKRREGHAEKKRSRLTLQGNTVRQRKKEKHRKNQRKYMVESAPHTHQPKKENDKKQNKHKKKYEEFVQESHPNYSGKRPPQSLRLRRGQKTRKDRPGIKEKLHKPPNTKKKGAKNVAAREIDRGTGQ